MSVISLLTAPARFALRTGRDALDAALDRGRQAVGRVVPDSDAPADAEREPVSVAVPMPPAPVAAPAETPPAARPAVPAPGAVEPDRTEQPEFQPVHLDEEPNDVVYSSSDEGAQDGAGAALHVGEPWKGYRGMTAPDVVDRLAVADAATLAAVQLYEHANRSRKTILAAVERRLAGVS